MGGRARLVGVAATAFAAAFVLAWWLFGSSRGGLPQGEPATSPAAVPVPPPAAVLAEADVEPFLAAAAARDFQAMARIGAGLFKPGNVIPGCERLFGEFAVVSFPPYQVYAFFTANDGERVYRVMLTVDADDSVESFMAEDMPVAR